MKKLSSTGYMRFLPTISLLLICAGLGLAFFFFSPSPASAFFVTPTPTQENLWAFVNISKATYTPTPIDTPTAISTETPGVMDLQVVADTPVPIIPTHAPVAQVQQAQSVPVSSGGKYILVDISEQHMYVYEYIGV